MKKTRMSLITAILFAGVTSTAIAGGAISDRAGQVNNAVGTGGQMANSGIDSVNEGLFGLVDSFAPGSGEEGSGTGTNLSSTPEEGGVTVLAGGKIGVNPYTKNCDTSQYSSAIADNIGKVGYRPSMSDNICGIGGLSNVNLSDLNPFGDGFLKKAFCSAVDMVASPVINQANQVIGQANSLTGIDYFNQLSGDIDNLSDVGNAVDAYQDYSQAGETNQTRRRLGDDQTAQPPRNLLTEMSWSDIGTTRSMDLGAEDILSVRFTVPQDATNVSGNFNVGGTGRHDVVINQAQAQMTSANEACRVASSANATMRFVTSGSQFGRCTLTPGETYFLNVRQNDTAGRAAVRLFHN